MNKQYIFPLFLLSFIAFAFSFDDNKKQEQMPDLGLLKAKSVDTILWSEDEIAIIKSLWIGNLPPLKPDPSNIYADNEKAAELGHLLFFETQLSKNGKVSCASCHRPELFFTDTLSQSKGTGKTLRHSPSLVGVAYNDWFYWDGRRDNHWSQVLNALEAEGEHESNRLQIVQSIFKNKTYRTLYQSVFGNFPTDISPYQIAASPRGKEAEKQAWENIPTEKKRAINHAFANIGKALAAYQRKLLPAPSRFDSYVGEISSDNKKNTPPLRRESFGQYKTLNEAEIRGLKLFIDPKSSCLNCHNGPLFTNHGFHNIGLPDRENSFPDLGRVFGIQAAFLDEFSCKSIYSDCDAKDCKELQYLNQEHIEGKSFKVPSLRNVSRTAPYMHDGRFRTLKDVINHYNSVSISRLKSRELLPLNASPQDMEALIAFLRTLEADVKADKKWLKMKR
jgi:cytochrome c peroxidase